MKTLINILKGLFSNQAVIDGRKTKWYFTLIVAILAIFLPWIPALSKGYTSDCAALLSATSNQEIDKGFRYILSEDYFKKINILQDEKQKYYLSMDFEEADYALEEEFTYEEEYRGINTKALFKSTYADKDGLVSPAIDSNNITSYEYDYYFDCISVDTSSVIDKTGVSSTSSTSTIVYENIGRNIYLQAYYFPTLSSTSPKAAQYLANFLYTIVFNIQSDKTYGNFPHSYIIMGQDFFNIAVYPLKASKSSTNYTGAYSGDLNCAFDVKSVQAGTSLYNYLSEDGTLSVDEIYKTTFHQFAHTAGRPAYLKSVWFNIMFLSIAVVGSFIVATVALIIINKRKVSIYRDTKWYESLTEAVLFSLSPAIIAMIIGFFNSTYSIVAVVVCILMRIFFVLNRICPPQDSGQDNKPLYQARS